MSNTCENSPTAAIPLPSEKPAAINGSTIAVNEPKTMNRTIAAARKPNNSPLPVLVEFPAWAMLPSTWNWTPSPEAEVITSTKCLAWAAVILLRLAALVKVTLAKAIWPLGAIWCAAPAAKGEATEATLGTCSTLANSCCARALTAGSVTLPWSTAITSWSVSPGRLGNRSLQQADGVEAARMGKLEVVGVGAAHRAVDHVEPGERDHPGGEGRIRCLKHQLASFRIPLGYLRISTAAYPAARPHCVVD